MEFNEAKAQFLQTWGALGSQWGINKTMAQIHALLMISPDSLSMEDVMEDVRDSVAIIRIVLLKSGFEILVDVLAFDA